MYASSRASVSGLPAFFATPTSSALNLSLFSTSRVTALRVMNVIASPLTGNNESEL
jgi:hypothetical protein